MKKGLYCKVLAVVTFILFIGVSYSTAISTNNKPNNSYIYESNEISNTKFLTNDFKENFDCTIFGFLGLSMGLSFVDGEGPLFDILDKIAELFPFLGLMLIPVYAFRLLYGAEYGGKIVIGEKENSFNDDLFPQTYIYKVHCNLWTNGLNGTVKFDGEYFGQISILYDSWETSWGLLCEEWRYVGVEGFTGIKSYNLAGGVFFIAGKAEHIALDTVRPK